MLPTELTHESRISFGDKKYENLPKFCGEFLNNKIIKLIDFI